MYSFQLFATPTFFSGMARTLDLGAVLDDYDGILTSGQADLLALSADWLAVSEDMWSALAEYESQIAEEISAREALKNDFGADQAEEKFAYVQPTQG
ncbi:MAG: hypothetical protein ACRD9Y_01410 [Blastocatellia bacterium]